MSENGSRHIRESAQRILSHIKAQQPHGVSFRTVLRMIAWIYRGYHACQCDQTVREFIRYGKERYGIPEQEFLEAARELFASTGEPVIYPDQERPEIIFGPNGEILWERPKNVHAEAEASRARASSEDRLP